MVVDFSALWRSLQKVLLPSDVHWRALFLAVALSYSLASLVLYFLALSNQALRPTVVMMWEATPFGMLSTDSPYDCGYSYDHEYCSIDEFEVQGPTLSNYLHTDGLGVVEFLLGGAIMVRLLLLCLQWLSDALGVDLVRRLIDKFLPGRSGE